MKVLQLCSTLTRTHSVAVNFLDAAGLPLLLSLPTSSLFVGQWKVKLNTVIAAANRQSNGRLTLRNLLLNTTFVISQDPVIFMRAARAVCQIEMVGERPYVVLLKDREKEKSKEKEKEKPQAATDGIIQHSEAISKSAKVNRKPPQSFTTVIELLLESIITFVPPSEDKAVVGESSLVIDMAIDVPSSKGKGKTIASGSEEKEDMGKESSECLTKVVFFMKLLKEILLMYGPSVNVLVRKDAEFSSSHGGIASQFLVASCVRSTEARRRIFIEVNNAFSDFADNCKVQRSPRNDIQAFVELLDDVLAARSPTGSSISREASATFIDVGLVRSLSRTLHMLDLDHADLLKVAPGLGKVLELVTKEHVHAAEANATKANNQVKPSGHLEHGGAENTGEVVESFSTVQAYGGFEFVTYDMEHDQDIDEGYAPPSEDDYMHKTSEETRGLDNGLASLATSGHNDQDDHEIEDEFDKDMIEEEDEDEEDDDGGVILRLGEGMNGINVLDHIEVFGRDHSFPNDTLHIMLHLERNLESSSSQLDSIFHNLRNGRQGQHGHRLSMWTDDQQSGGSNASSIPSGLEDFLVSYLTRPTLEKASDQDKMDAQTKNESGEFQESAGMVPETTADTNSDSDQADARDSGNTPTIDESQGGHVGQPQSVDMHFEQNDRVVCDVEAVSQESSGSGATLGESLRSLDVEIRSANGQDDGGERQGPRRINASLRNTSVSLRDAYLHSVTEVLENPSQDTDQSDPEPQNDGDNPEFLAALPPDIRAEVLAQQQAQGVHRSCELEGQPVEMDTVNQAWTGLPRGVKFDPLDHGIIWHLLTKSGVSGFPPHPFIDEFIPTVKKDDGISYTHPQKLPGFVVVPRGSLCQLNVKANVGLPPNAIYNNVTDPDNKRVFKNILEVLSRKVLVDEGSRQVVKIKQVAIWRFLWWLGTISVHVLVDQNREDYSINSRDILMAVYIIKVELLAAKNLIGAYLNGMSDPRKKQFSNNAIFVHVNYAARMVLGSSNPIWGEEFNFYMDKLPVKEPWNMTENKQMTVQALDTIISALAQSHVTGMVASTSHTLLLSYGSKYKSSLSLTVSALVPKGGLYRYTHQIKML
ncbi:E3 ubiquitin protein ligase UPL2-like protein [Tanacetum coccineum]